VETKVTREASHPPTDDQRYGFLDLLVTLAEAHRLLILGPIIVSALALGITSFMAGDSSDYEIKARVVLSPDASALMQQAALAGAVADHLQLNISGAALGSRLSVEENIGVGRMVTLRWEDAEEGQQVLQSMIDAASSGANEKGERIAARTQRRIDTMTTRIAQLQAWHTRITDRLEATDIVNVSGDVLGLVKATDWTLARRLELAGTVGELEAVLHRVKQDGQIVSDPAFSIIAVPSDRLTLLKVIPYLAAVAALLVLLAVVILRESIRRAGEDAATLAKFGRIRQAFWPW
jgi:hypothetical protein